ncbi:hypothetical protein D3C80_1960130 [compost metagenome]
MAIEQFAHPAGKGQRYRSVEVRQAQRQLFRGAARCRIEEAPVASGDSLQSGDVPANDGVALRAFQCVADAAGDAQVSQQ